MGLFQELKSFWKESETPNSTDIISKEAWLSLSCDFRDLYAKQVFMLSVVVMLLVLIGKIAGW